MKKVEAFIRPEKLEDIKEAVSGMNLNGLSISQIMGCGRQKGWTEFVRGTEVDYHFLPKIKVELVVPDGDVEKLVETIITTAQTGNVGDGKIFIYDVVDAIRVRTKERGEAAIK